jgi:hypothetical protein
VFKTAAIAALPSLHAAEGRGLEPLTLIAPPASEAGAIAALPSLQRCPRMRAAVRVGLEPTEAPGAPSRFQRDAIAALPSHRGGATGTRTLISGVRYRRSPVER